MNLRDLRYLVAVADHRHFGRAAEACFVSQPTLSTQIKKLEGFLGVQLVERNHKQVMLTPVGSAIAERARQIINQADDLVQYAKAAADPLGGDLRLGFIPTSGPYLLPHLMPALGTQLPRLRPLLYEDQTARLIERLQRGQLDAGLMAVPVDVAGFDHVEVFAEPFVVALPPGHPLAVQERIALQDLAREKVLLLEEGHCLRDQALDICNRVGVREDEEFRATSMETLRQMVSAGVGITLLPALAAEVYRAFDAQGRLELRPFSDEPPVRRMALYWRRSAAREQTLRAVAEVIAGLSAVKPA
ncbi:LysR substrate-binding domain-containing protein [Alkalilimnicola sp. S0819]|uniref:LysR substrate-binding domain-containing protein n=1 Tax=Alkalilimnicola sp. S0819 TaxID=2613922 RepID=UPI0012614071|nr:LysR substrate-binding domain-containing protein [Alkalilimnicola sp. S0819]KAB7624194.1 LysR family transcriptional regulator [Alkalilimnicola sp. S0819]MPQ16449.1 LysR family transcriptional regulator [Alkalilimnicola sp. S0819]